MINHTQAEPMGILTNVLCQVGVTTIIAKFMILDIPIDRDAPIVVGRGFLHTIGGIVNTLERLFSTFDGIRHQTFCAARSNVLRTAESDSDDEEEYEIKRNKFGAPNYGLKLAAYLNCNDPAERSSALQAVINPFQKISEGLVIHLFGGSNVLRTAESDSNDEEEYEIKRNKFGAPNYGLKLAAYLNCNDPAERSSALQAVINPFQKISEGLDDLEVFSTDALGLDWISTHNFLTCLQLLSSYTSGHLKVSELAACLEKLHFPTLLVMSKSSRICFSFVILEVPLSKYFGFDMNYALNFLCTI
ncbi:hypothetical protein Tco_1477265 [Tanacetum coccineum]